MPGSAISPDMSSVGNEDIEDLLSMFSRAVFDVKLTDMALQVHSNCQDLFEKDYEFCVVENVNGELSKNYPSYIVIPTKEKAIAQNDGTNENNQWTSSIENFNSTKFKSLATKASHARCWGRCPVPVILFEGKFVCRSSTLACLSESVLRDFSCYLTSGVSRGDTTEKPEHDEKDESELVESSDNMGLRILDIKLLKELAVTYICDLMVENKKRKFNVPISSSEKIDKQNRYSDFKIVQLPYPGCEFFKQFKDNNYVARNLRFDWTQTFVDSQLLFPSDASVSPLRVRWPEYKTWDVVKLTQCYLKQLIKYITEGSSSILIHCISGWDRTPLFISLLRLSLWADGKIHHTLTPMEMTYLTLAYDWYLFGHNLPSRLNNGEEILFFCFHFLKYITSESYSSTKREKRTCGNVLDPTLSDIIEDSSNHGSISSLSSNESQDNHPPSSFIAYTDSVPENNSRSIFYASIESSGESDRGVPESLADVQDSSGRSAPSTMTNSANSDNAANNNGVGERSYSANQTVSSSPVPVPNVGKGLDSLSSNGSWQFVSASGSSMQGSSTDKSSLNSNASEVNQNASRPKNPISLENNESGPSPLPHHKFGTREEKLTEVQKIFHSAYKRVISNNRDRPGVFGWLR